MYILQSYTLRPDTFDSLEVPFIQNEISNEKIRIFIHFL